MPGARCPTCAAVLNHRDPLAPLLWLAEALRARGLGIEAGEMISTGSMTGMLPVPKGGIVEARFGALATVRIDFRG